MREWLKKKTERIGKSRYQKTMQSLSTVGGINIAFGGNLLGTRLSHLMFRMSCLSGGYRDLLLRFYQVFTLIYLVCLQELETKTYQKPRV